MKTRVYFGVFQFGHYDEVSKALGLKPTSAWNIGDRKRLKKGSRILKNARWCYGDTRFNSKDVNEKLSKILHVLKGKNKLLRQAARKWPCKMVIAGSSESWNFDEEVSLDNVKLMSSLGLSIWIDLYAF